MSPTSSPSNESSARIPAVPRANWLALFSLVLGAVAPVVALAAVVAHLVRASEFATFLAGVLGQWTVPTSLAAIISGHIALIQAKNYAPAQARRAAAIAGLILGYGALVVFLGFLGYILATFH